MLGSSALQKDISSEAKQACNTVPQVSPSPLSARSSQPLLRDERERERAREREGGREGGREKDRRKKGLHEWSAELKKNEKPRNEKKDTERTLAEQSMLSLCQAARQPPAMSSRHACRSEIS